MKDAVGAKRLAFVFLAGSLAICQASTAWVTVCCNNPGPLSLYNTRTGQRLPQIDTGAPNPIDALFSHDGKTIYVANEGPYETDPTVGQITFIDTESGAVKRKIPVNNAPRALFLSPDESKLFVLAFVTSLADGTFTVYSIDIATGAVLAESSQYSYVDTGYGRVLFAPDGLTAYLLTGEQIYVLDARTLQQTASLLIGLGNLTVSGAISPDGSTIYVPAAVGREAGITAVDTKTLAIKWTLPISDERAQGPIVLNAAGDTIYAVVKSTPRTLVLVSTDTQSVLAAKPIDGYPEDLALSPDERTVYGVIQGALISIDVSSGLTKEAEAAPGYSYYASLNAANGLIVVADAETDEIQGIDLATGATTGTILIGFSKGVGNALQFTPNYQRAISVEVNGISEVDVQAGKAVERAYVPGISTAVYVPGTQTAYAVGGDFTGATSELYAVNLETGYAGAKLALPFNEGSVVMALSADGKALYVASELYNILIIDTDTFEITGIIPIVASALATTLSQPSLLYISNYNHTSPQFFVWNLETHSIVLTVPLPVSEYAVYLQLQLLRDGSRAYAMDNLGDIASIDLLKGKVDWTTYPAVPGFGYSFSASPDGQFVAAMTELNGSLIVLDGHTGAQIATYPLIGPGGAVAVTE